VAVTAGTGTLLGSVAGFAGGGVDALLMALVDLLLGFPGVLLAIAFVAVMGSGLGTLILSLTLIGWVAYARLARSLVLGLKANLFVDAGHSIGATRARLLLRHLLPHLAGPVLVQASLGFGGIMLAEAGLSFLGLGVPPPTPSWGSMLRTGSQNLLDAPRLAIVPGAALFISVLGANLLGEGLGAWLDPSRRPAPGLLQ
jgi:peptide/nickel transport system permease protein